MSVYLSVGLNKIGITSRNGVIGQAFARLQRGAQDAGVSTDLQRTFIGLVAACQHHELSRAIILGKRFRAPAWRPASGAGDNPDLEQCSGFVLQIIFAMTHAGPGTHDLDIARLGSPCVAQAVLMRNGALTDIDRKSTRLNSSH